MTTTPKKQPAKLFKGKTKFCAATCRPSELELAHAYDKMRKATAEYQKAVQAAKR